MARDVRGRHQMGQAYPGISAFSTNLTSDTMPVQQVGSAARCDGTEFADPLAAPGAVAASTARPTGSVPDEITQEICLDQILEEARLATAATGAAIALVRGTEMVCCATTGPDAPGLGARLDPGSGLSGCCIQTHELQQCNDTETDPRVDLEVCRRLGVRSIVVLPLMDSGELFGVFEILSSRPDAFGESDLCHLKTLANRIPGSRPPLGKADASMPPQNHAADPMQTELLAREVFQESVQRGARPRRRKNRTAIPIAALIALALVLGWMLGHSSWQMAVDRAEREISRSQEEVQPAPQAAPDNLPASSSGGERSTLAPSETASPSENEAGKLQGDATQESDFAAVPAPISSEGDNSYVLRRVNPRYPDEARQQRLQGRVVMRVFVGTNGLVRELVVTVGDPQLAKAAAKAVRQWRFKPHTLEGQPVEFETLITVNFTLT